MTKLYFCDRLSLYTRLDEVLKKHLPSYEIKRTESGKPYLEGTPLHFSLSHSGDTGVIALSNSPIGVDVEVIKGKEHNAIIKRMSARERAEIACERDFLKHWTAREAYIKLYGLTLAKTWRHVEFFDGKLYVDGEAQKVKFATYTFGNGIICVCREV